jgi:hypothetical protein
LTHEPGFVHRYATIIKATIYYFLPLTIIGILYTLMAQKLQKSATEVQNIASCPLKVKNPQAQNRRHVARMVIVFILGQSSPMIALRPRLTLVIFSSL